MNLDMGFQAVLAWFVTAWAAIESSPWGLPVLTVVGVVCVAVRVYPVLAAWRYRNTLPDLADLDREHAQAASGVWRVGPPCGYPTWDLFAPGQSNPDADWPTHGITPVGKFSAVDGPGYDPTNDGREPLRIEELAGWMRPWIEEVSGGRVVKLVEGWGAPYGPGRDQREWAAFARVEGGQR